MRLSLFSDNFARGVPVGTVANSETDAAERLQSLANKTLVRLSNDECISSYGQLLVPIYRDVLLVVNSTKSDPAWLSGVYYKANPSVPWYADANPYQWQNAIESWLWICDGAARIDLRPMLTNFQMDCSTCRCCNPAWSYPERPNLSSKSLSHLWSLGFGKVNQETLLNVTFSSSAGLVLAVILANLPQVFLSFIYLSFNAPITCMMLAEE